MIRTVTVQNTSRKLDQPLKLRYCADFWNKFRGLMLQRNISHSGGALLVEGKDSRMNASIHMLFMRFDIVAIWINNEKKVVDIQVAKRWRLAYLPAQPARYILETHISQVNNFKIGDQIAFSHD